MLFIEFHPFPEQLLLIIFHQLLGLPGKLHITCGTSEIGGLLCRQNGLLELARFGIVLGQKKVEYGGYVDIGLEGEGFGVMAKGVIAVSHSNQCGGKIVVNFALVRGKAHGLG